MNSQCHSDLLDLLRVPLGMLGDDDYHFIGTYGACSGMRMRHLGSAEIFSVLLDKGDDAVADSLELVCGFGQGGEASSRLSAFRRLHLAAAVGRVAKENLLAIGRAGGAGHAL